jgi:hypothetical protein
MEASDDSCKFKDGEDNNDQAYDIDYIVHGILRQEIKLAKV